MVWILKIMAKILEQELRGLCACLCVHMDQMTLKYFLHKLVNFSKQTCQILTKSH